jgi:protein O-mannosyl-transferase
MSARLTTRKTVAAISVLLAVMTFVLYVPIVHNQFINFDDDEYIVNNVHIQHGLNWTAVKWAFTAGYANNWHPVTWLVHIGNYQMFHLHPAGHHVVNLLLHVANTVLVFLLLRRMTGSLWRTAVVAGLFAWHPLHVESIAWAAELKDVLSTLFFMLTLVAYTRYVELRAVATTNRRNVKLWYAASLVLFACGLMAKPMLVTLPYVLLLLDFWPFKRINTGTIGKLAREKFPFVALSIAVCTITVVVQSKTIGFTNFPLPDRLLNAIVACARYLGKTFWPEHLVVIYPYFDPKTYSGWLIGTGILLLITGGWLSWKLRRRAPFVAFGWLWFLGMLVPVIGIIQVGAQSMADRYMYLPSIGLFVALVWSFSELTLWKGVRQIAVAASFVVLCGFAVRTYYQLQYWQNSETLFRHALALTKNNDIALNNLGCVLLEQQKYEEARDCFIKALHIRPDANSFANAGLALKRQNKLNEAKHYLLQAIKLRPDYSGAFYHLGTIANSQGDMRLAIDYFQKAVRYDPENVEAYNGLGVALGAAASEAQSQSNEAVAQKYRIEAAQTFSNALALVPANLELRLNLGNVLADQGRNREAINVYNEVLKRNPTNDVAHYDLATTFSEMGQSDDAIREFTETVRLNPQHGMAQNNLGMLLLDAGKVDDARQHLEKAAQLCPATASVQYNLGSALLKLGQKDEAKAALTRAVTLDPGYKQAVDELHVSN